MRRWLMFIVLLALSGGALAQEVYNVPSRALDSAGIDRRTFSLIHLSEDGHQVLGWDRPPVTLKRKGQKVRLWLLEFDSAFKLKSSKSYGMDLPSLEQAHFTQDGQGVVIISRQGAEFYKLDLSTGLLTTILTHVKGQPGFRSQPPILTWTEGKLITNGYLYDENDVTQEVGVAEVNPDATGVAAFTPGPSIAKLEQSVPGLQGSITVSPRAMFFYGKQGQEATVYCWTPTEGLKPIDKAGSVLGWWGEQSRFLYSLAKPGGSNELVLYDANFGRRTSLANTSQAYESLSLSRDGTAAVGCQLLPGSRMNVIGFAEKTNWQPRELLKNWPLSVLRISPDGNVLALYDPTKGVTLVRVQ